jgi:hypothetical protein
VPLSPAANAGSHSFAERQQDLYETPDVAVRALMRVERLPHFIWEPACGPGRIVRVLREAGHKVYATDLIDYGCEDSESRVDFLMTSNRDFSGEAIVTNPPFKLAHQFVIHALTLCPKVIMLLRLAFYESDRRKAILEGGQLARVHVFSKRLPMMHRAGWEGRKASSGMAFAWFVWNRDHKGPTELRRISWSARFAAQTPEPTPEWHAMWARPFDHPEQKDSRP